METKTVVVVNVNTQDSSIPPNLLQMLSKRRRDAYSSTAMLGYLAALPYASPT